MKCRDIQQMLIAYLDREATPLEQKQLRDHIAGCANCQGEMVRLRNLQSHLHRSLRIEAAQVTPSPGAWGRLQARLGAETIAPPARGSGLLHRLSLMGVNHQKAGGKNEPVNDTAQDWSWIITPAIKQWWKQGLVWAARWSSQSRVDRPSNRPFSIRNKPVSKPKTGDPGSSDGSTG